MQKKTPPFQARKIYGRLLSYVWPYRYAFLLGILGNVLYGVIDAGIMKLLGPLIDKGFVEKDLIFIRWIPIILILIFILRGCASFLSTFFMGWVGRNVVMNLRQAMFNHALKLPAAYYDSATSGEILSKITYNVEQVANASSDALTELVRETCAIIGLIGVMLYTSWRLTLLFIILVPMMAIIMHVVGKRMRLVSSRIQDTMGGVTHTIEEAIEGQRVIKAFGGEPYEIRQFEKVNQRNRRQEMKLIAVNAISIPMIQLIGACALSGMIYLVLSPNNMLGTKITPGDFATMMGAMVALLKPIKQLMRVNGNIQKGIAGASSIFAFLDEQPEIDLGKKKWLTVKGDLSFKHVSFSYQRENLNPVLKEISFEVKAGETIAIVGRSGGGKSTLVNLLPRFYDALGEICIDGVNIRELPLRELRRHIAIVSQQVTLFNDTVARNIAYGQENVSLEEVIHAAKSAYAYEFIQSLPQGLDTLIGENGVRLSGGQRQRIAIARAILKKAPILILDEATSALDTESERYIQVALEQLMAQCTTLVIAHRLSTIENASRILVIDRGKIIEMGTHEVLMQANGAYAALRMMQYQEVSPMTMEAIECEMA